MKNKKILGLIIARKGSKGVKNKNIKNFKGKPLAKWTLEAAKKSRYLSPTRATRVLSKKTVFIGFLCVNF